MPANLVAFRAQVERALAGRVHAPFTIREHQVKNVPTGISEVDALAGGLPRGALTEIFGPPCLGRTSLLFSALSVRTMNAGACALLEGCDAFESHRAESGGSALQNLLRWR